MAFWMCKRRIHDEDTYIRWLAELDEPLPSERLTYAGRQKSVGAGAPADLSVMQAMMAAQGS